MFVTQRVPQTALGFSSSRRNRKSTPKIMLVAEKGHSLNPPLPREEAHVTTHSMAIWGRPPRPVVIRAFTGTRSHTTHLAGLYRPVPAAGHTPPLLSLTLLTPWWPDALGKPRLLPGSTSQVVTSQEPRPEARLPLGKGNSSPRRLAVRHERRGGGHHPGRAGGRQGLCMTLHTASWSRTSRWPQARDGSLPWLVSEVLNVVLMAVACWAEEQKEPGYRARNAWQCSRVESWPLPSPESPPRNVSRSCLGAVVRIKCNLK